MKKLIFLGCFLLIMALIIISLGKQATLNLFPRENFMPIHHDQGLDYENIATILSVNIDDLKNAFEESEPGTPFDLAKIASQLNVTEQELQEAMGPPPPRENEPDSQPQPFEQKSSGKIYSSLTADYGNVNFEINSTAIENGIILDAYKCEEKIKNKENSIPLSWNNIPEKTKSLAIVMYHYPNPNDKTNRNSYLLLWGIDPAVREIAYGEADHGEWYMGPNKDGNAISYTSPCSQGPGVHEYVISIFALAEFPKVLPEKSSLDLNFDLFMTAIEDVEILGRADIVFKDIKK